MPIKRISQLLIEKGLSSVPVVNEKNELVGLVSEKDILKGADIENFPNLTAGNVMVKDVVYVKENDHVEIAIRIFTEGSYRVLPVLRDKTVVGLITRGEILSASFGESY